MNDKEKDKVKALWYQARFLAEKVARFRANMINAGIPSEETLPTSIESSLEWFHKYDLELCEMIGPPE